MARSGRSIAIQIIVGAVALAGIALLLWRVVFPAYHSASTIEAAPAHDRSGGSP